MKKIELDEKVQRRNQIQKIKDWKTHSTNQSPAFGIQGTELAKDFKTGSVNWGLGNELDMKKTLKATNLESIKFSEN